MATVNQASAAEQSILSTNQVQKDTLVVGSEQDYPPFATGMTDATADGFTVDLWKAVAAEAGLNYVIRVRPFHEILQEFKEGKIDVLINLAQSEERHQFADFTVPHVIIHGAIFVRKGESQIHSEDDFVGKSIIVLKADLAYDYAVSKGWEKKLVLVDTAEQGLRLLASGKNDAMLISKLAGMQTLRDLKISNIGALDVKAGFTQKFSFAVHKGDADLLARINEGLALTKPSGTFDVLYEKWFRPYEEKQATFWEVFWYLSPIILILLGFASYEFYKRRIEHNRASEQLKNREKKFRSIIEISPVPMALNDAQLNINYLNSAFIQTFGYCLEDIPTLAAWWLKAYPDSNYREWVKTMWQARFEQAERENKPFAPMELSICAKGGAFKTVEVSATIIAGSDEHLVVLFDITERKQNEAVILLAKDQAESLARSKSEFLATMSHEIRTPMNAIIGLSQLALVKALSVETRDYLEKIYSSSTSLLSILNDILDFSKLEAGRIDIDNVTFNLDVLLDNLNSLFADLVKEKHLGFDIQIDPDVPRNLIGDTLRLQQVLVNLLSNAIKFTELGSVKLNITVSQIDRSQVRLLFCVADTGIGMSDTDYEKLFQPFSQVDDSITRRFGGTGLGLAISHNLLQLMDSEFSVASVPGKGTSFSFELVLGMSTLSAQHTSATSFPTSGDLGELLTDIRILVVEDNRINQQVVKGFLNLSGIIVEIANNGKEAIALLENRVFDAVLMDVHMPILDGLEATKLIRSQARFATLPVIALTAGVTKEERERCMASGMNDFIAKPINPKTLISTLLQWIKPSEATAAITEPGVKKTSYTGNLPDLTYTIYW